MKQTTRYWAEWVAEILPPPTGEEWNPDRDIRYERSGPYRDAMSAARVARERDLDGEGAVITEEARRDRWGGFWTPTERVSAVEI